MFKVNNKDFIVFVVNFNIYFTPCFSVSIVNFEQTNAGWVRIAFSF